MSRNGSGTYNLPSGNPVVTGTTITSNWANTTMTDIANALTGSVAADGQTPMSGNLNMATNQVKSLAEPTASTDATTKNYVDTAVATLSGSLGTMAVQNASSVNISGGTITGSYALNTTGTSGSIANTGGWSVTPSGTTLYFAYNGTNVAKLDSSGNLTVKANVTAYGTV